jgi:hypothetical protein
MAKTPAQLGREIAEVLTKEPSKARQISDRRMAYLVSKGEDARNTVAWRDAVVERRMLDFAEGIRGTKRGKRSDLTRVTIVWYAFPNMNKRDARGGFMPVYELDGKVRGDTYGRGYDKEEAEQLAEAMAHKEAERYIGDWDVIVKKGRAKRS